jgi:hypothetical protein
MIEILAAGFAIIFFFICIGVGLGLAVHILKKLIGDL